MTILKIKNLSTSFKSDNGKIVAIDDISLSIKKNEIFGLVGESGSGKSVLALSILKLLPKNGIIEKGEIFFKNDNIFSFKERKMQEIRGNKIGMIFQDPASSLSPLLKIDKQIIEAILFHNNYDKKKIINDAIKCFKSLNIDNPKQKLFAYPHQLSGGIKQRIIIAISLMQKPEIIIADEPTTALDVRTQAQILDIFKNIVKKQSSILL